MMINGAPGISTNEAHTSSRDKACLNHLMVLFVPTKGSVFPLRIPTLATVSLRRDTVRLKDACMHREEMSIPYAKEIYRDFAAKGLFELNCQLVVFAARAFVEPVREPDLLEVVL